MPETAYTEDKYWHNYPDGIGEHFWFIARNRMIEAALKPLVRPDDLILDIGCGRGHTVSHLRSKNFDCHGVEVGHPEVLAEARAFVHTGKDALDLPASLRKRVTVAMLLDVIEHLPDPVDFLKRVLKSLPNCRLILVTVPARKELWTNYDEYFGHYRRYNRSLLKAQGGAAGLRLLRLRYLFHALYLPVMLSRLSGVRRKVELTPPRSLAFHAALGWWFTLENLIMPPMLPGTSVMALFEPQRPQASRKPASTKSAVKGRR